MQPRQASPRGGFPSTRWSRILGGAEPRDLEALARTYFGPIRAWLAARLRRREDDADDLAQDAFAWMLSRRLFDRADPARGSFRAFLKTALARFAIERHRHEHAARRGAGRTAPLEPGQEPPDPNAPTPDALLDAAWRRDLLAQAHAELRRELEASGRGTYFALFSDYYLAEDDAVDHATLAERHGIGRGDVANWLDYAKRRYRAVLRALVRDTVTDEEALRAELAWLFGTPAPGEDGR